MNGNDEDRAPATGRWPRRAWWMALALVYLGCFLWYADRRSLYCDECLTLQMASAPTAAALVEDVRRVEWKPPLHFLYAQLVLDVLPESARSWPLLLRLSSLPFVVAIVVLVRRMAREGAAVDPLVWLTLLLGSQLLFVQAALFRLYAMFAALCLLTLWTGFRYARTGTTRDRVAWFACALATLYTQVHGCVAVAAQGFLLLGEALWRRDGRRAGALVLDGLLLLVCWWPQVQTLRELAASGATEGLYQRAFDAFTPFILIASFHGAFPSAWGLLLITLVSFWLFVIGVSRALRAPGTLPHHLAWYTLLGLLLMCAAGLVNRYSFMPRYYLFLLAPYLFLALNGASALRTTPARVATGIVLVGTLVPTLLVVGSVTPWVETYAAFMSTRPPGEGQLVTFGNPFDYVVVVKHYGLRLEPLRVYWPPGGHPPVWLGGEGVPPEKVFDDFGRLVADGSVTRIWHLCSNPADALPVQQRLGPSWRVSALVPLVGPFELDPHLVVEFRRTGR